MPPLEDPIEDNTDMEIFGDLPDDEDLDSLDRGDTVEEIQEPDPAPAEEEAAAEPEPEPEPVREEAPEAEEPAAEAAPEVAPEPEPEPEPAPVPEGAESIPKARLDNQIAKTRALEAELERLRQAQAQQEEAEKTPPYDFKAKISEEYEAVLQGDTEKAAAIRLEIEEQRQAMQAEQFQQMAAQTTTQTKAQLEFESVVEDLTEKFPVFNPESEVFNEDMLNDVLFKRDAYHAQGMPLSDALSMATTEVAKLNGIEAAGGQVSRETPASMATPPEKPKVDPKEVERKIEASNAQPPDIQGEASDAHGTTALDFESMTEEEFDALPESTLRRYRGD